VEESNIIIAIISLGIGGTLGYLAGRSSSQPNGSEKQQIDQLKAEMNEYKDSVAHHFQQTSNMVNDMNNSYKGVIQHLAKGSQDLCEAAVAADIESRLIPNMTNEKVEKPVQEDTAAQTTANVMEPPRDYAPKKPDEMGALSENYGIQGQGVNAPEETQGAEAVTPPLDAAVSEPKKA
jgi:uncharacterized membrane-anchored protein YhcB (DUF1043 family)